jgi:hypothetical protein
MVMFVAVVRTMVIPALLTSRTAPRLNNFLYLLRYRNMENFLPKLDSLPVLMRGNGERPTLPSTYTVM